jgi:hypothetical protein
MLTEQGLHVERNPGTARPRQTDLFANDGSRDYVIEVKWRTTEIGVDDVDGLLMRLRDVTSDVAGVVISMSDYTDSARERVLRHKGEREILLFAPFEVRALFDMRLRFSELAQKKREGLRRDGRVWFYTPERKGTPRLPISDETLYHGKMVVDAIGGHGEFDTVVFARTIPAFHGKSFNDLRARLALQLPEVDSVSALGWALDKVNRRLHLSGHGAFSVLNPGNPHRSWHGIGLERFLATLHAPDFRYQKGNQLHQHHTEVLAYFDSFEDGFVTLEADRRLPGRAVHSVGLDIHMPGIPVDTGPFVRLCQELGARRAVFELTGGEHWSLEPAADEVYLRKKLPLEVVGHIERRIEPVFDKDLRTVISAIVARNPFSGRRDEVEKLVKTDSPIADMLFRPEFLICHLRDQLEPGDEVDGYHLVSVEAVAMERANVLRPTCTWGTLTYCPHRQYRKRPLAPKAGARERKKKPGSGARRK